MLCAENLTCHRDRRPVLDAVDLHVLPGETVALTGPGAAGKTALLEAFAGRLPVTSGRACVGEADVMHEPAAAFAAIAYVPATLSFAPAVSGLAHLREVAARLGRRIPEPILRATLERSGLRYGLHVQRVGDYPLPARRQLAFAAASLKNAPALLLDEPARDLDAAGLDELVTGLRRLRKRGTAVLLATRDLILARRLATRIVYLEAGSIVATAEPQHSRRHHAEASYLSALV